MAKSRFKPLTRAQKKLCPYGTNKCRLCRMPVKDLKHVHYLRFDDKLSLREVLKKLKEEYGMSCNLNQLCEHFNKHINTTQQPYLEKGNKTCGGGLVEKRVAKVAEVLSPMVAENVRIDSKLETAYSALVSMTKDYAVTLDKLKDLVDKRFEDTEKLDKDLKKYDPLKLLNAYTTFRSALGSQINEINNLRAPKVLMVQFLEATLKKIVEDMSVVFTMVCSSLQDGITHEMRKQGAGKLANNQLFAPTFQRVAQEYQSKMTETVREQLYQARLALAELSKIQ